jgi:hypothetical protein
LPHSHGIDKSAELTYKEFMPTPIPRAQRRRPSGGLIRQNWKFACGMVGLCAPVALGTAIATQGIESMMSKASLAMKAMDDPGKLSKEEKDKLKSLLTKDKGSAKKAFENLPDDQKQRAKEMFGGMGEKEKEHY